MKCPKCNAEGTLYFGSVYQVCHEHRVNKNGTIAKRYKKTPEYYEEWHYISCSNCGLYMTGHDNNTYEIKNNKIVFESEREAEQ